MSFRSPPAPINAPPPAAKPTKPNGGLDFVLNLNTANLSRSSQTISVFGFGDPETFQQRVDRIIRNHSGAPTAAFSAFLDKCMQHPQELEAALDDEYRVSDSNTERYPVEDAFRMLKQLYALYIKEVQTDAQLPGLGGTTAGLKDLWEPYDVLQVLCNVNTKTKLLGYGRFGVTFEVYNPTVHSAPFVFKISVDVTPKIRQFYRIERTDDNFKHQRRYVPYGSLEQYMQKMSWVDRSNAVLKSRPEVQLVNNAALTLPCTLLVMEKLEGGPPPAAFRSEVQKIVQQLDAAMKALGVNHDDLEPGNILVTYTEQPMTLSVKVIDFGQATPSGTPPLRVGQPS